MNPSAVLSCFGPTGAPLDPHSGEALPAWQILVDALLAVPRGLETVAGETLAAAMASPAARSLFAAPELPVNPLGGAPLPYRLGGGG